MRNESLPPRSKASNVGFTLIELLVVIGIIAVLAGLLLPTMASVQENSRSSQCVSNLREISLALNLYANDNNNNFPALTTSANLDWDSNAITPYLSTRAGTTRQSTLFICPDAKYTGDTNSDLSRTYSATDCMVDTIAANYTYTTPNSRSHLASFAKSLILFDACQSGSNRYSPVTVSWASISGSGDLQANGTTNTYIDYRHRRAFHGLFADGHVDTIKRTDASTVLTQTMWRGY